MGFTDLNRFYIGEFMVREIDVVKVWDEAAESWIEFVREGKDYYREGLNNPATFRLIGNVKGKRVLDLACGEGYNTRILARKGAVVVGVDFSEKMIERARKDESVDRLGITYLVSDAADLKELPSSHFDLVTCFMSLHDIERYEDAVSEVARVLNKKGRFVFSIPHPCFEGIMKDRKGWRNISGMRYDEEAENLGEGASSQLEKRSYFEVVRYEVFWTMERITKPFKTVSFHRTLTDYFQALHRNGLLVLRLIEPRPTLKAAAKYPQLKKVRRIPQSAIIETMKMKEKVR